MNEKTNERINRFMFLNQIDVGEHVEKKLNLSYLSWAWAWSKFCEFYPDSQYTVHEREDGVNYWTDGKTCWVKTSVTLVDGDYQKTITEMLPVMDARNKSIPCDAVTSMDVNKAIQRCLTKAIARHGLGLYIYAGEDIPEETEETKTAKITAAKEMSDIIKKIGETLQVLTKNMTKEEKLDLANNTIAPITGTVKYMECKDLTRLNMLLDELNKMTNK